MATTQKPRKPTTPQESTPTEVGPDTTAVVPDEHTHDLTEADLEGLESIDELEMAPGIPRIPRPFPIMFGASGLYQWSWRITRLPLPVRPCQRLPGHRPSWQRPHQGRLQ